MIYNATHVTTAPVAKASSWGETFQSDENKNYLITFTTDTPPKFSLFKKVGFADSKYYYVAVTPGNNDKIKVTSSEPTKAGVWYVTVTTTTNTSAIRISD